MLDRRGVHDRLVCDVLEPDDRAPTPRAVGGDQHLRRSVVDAILQRLRGEPPEHHGVGRADAGARQHRSRGLGHHSHVDRDPVAFADAELAQRVRDAARLVEQLLVGDPPRVAGLALPEEGHLVAVAGGDVSVEAALGDVERAAHEPLRERQFPIEDRVPLLAPVERERLFRPEALPIVLGLVVDRGAGDEGVLGESLRRGKRPPFLQEGFECFSHAADSSHTERRTSAGRVSRPAVSATRKVVTHVPGR